MKQNTKTIKAIYATIIVFGLLCSSISNANKIQVSLDNCTKKTFTTTAYYSPQPNQIAYAKGNIIDEKILNGQGTHGASGEPVFPGMIAAPPNYQFGDYIITELGVGKISDRGGAIVNAGKRNNQHDRLDIWMGHGNEGLIRAISRGKQDIEAYHCAKTLNIPPKAIGINRSKVPNFKNFYDMAFSMIQLEEGRKDIFVLKLQKYLSRLGYLDEKRQTGYFGPITKQAICQFQIDNGIVQKGSKWCGVFGPKTRYSLNQTLKQKKLYPSDFRTTTELIKVVYEGKRLNNLIN